MHRLITHRLRCTGIALCLLGTGTLAQQLEPLPAEAVEAPPRYSVEFILFRYSESVSSGSELFLPDRPTDAESAVPTFGDVRSMNLGDDGQVLTDPAYGDRPELLDDLLPGEAEEMLDEELVVLPSTRDIELRVLTEEELTLEEQYSTLSRLGAYEPVLWSGWTQTVRDEAETPSISLRRLGRIPLAFDGDLKLYLGRFLHLVVDLSLTDSVPVADLNAPAARPEAAATALGNVQPGGSLMQQISFRITEDRIVRNGDQRYFDHPKFGLLTKLTRVEDPPPAETDESILLPGS